MMIMLHVIIALLSIASATFALIVPGRILLSVSYGFVFATLASGVALAVLTPGVMLHVCMSGLVYLGAVSVLLVVARSKYITLSRQ